MSHPNLPVDMVTSELLEHWDLEEIWQAVCRELVDLEYKNRSHHNPKTYNVGCRGPLCRKAIRDYAGRRGNSPTKSKYAQVNPVLMFYMEEAQTQIAEHEAGMLEKLIS